MLNLLLQYLRKTQKIWVEALIITLLFFGILSLVLLIPGMLYVFTSILVVHIPMSLLRMLGYKAIADALAMPLIVVTLIYMPALALTATTVIGVAAIISILFFFERFDAMAREVVGIGFSLKKLFLNPRGRLETLRPILEEQTLDYARYLNLVNDITSPNTAEYCESLELSQDQEDELVQRQIQAMIQLPEDFKALREEIEARDWHSSNLDTTIAEKKAAYQAYRSQLTDVQQARFDTYLDSSLELTHAICSVSLEPLSPENQHQFIMLEKRYKEGGNWHAVPNETKFFYLDPNERDLFLNLAQYNKVLKRWTITNPFNRDPIFTPSGYGASLLTTQYRRYNYQVIEGHPLSLQVCEAIEAFNDSMQISHEETLTDVRQNHSEPIPPFNRSTQVTSSLTSSNNIYEERQRRNMRKAASSLVAAENDDVFSSHHV